MPKDNYVIVDLFDEDTTAKPESLVSPNLYDQATPPQQSMVIPDLFEQPAPKQASIGGAIARTVLDVAPLDFLNRFRKKQVLTPEEKVVAKNYFREGEEAVKWALAGAPKDLETIEKVRGGDFGDIAVSGFGLEESTSWPAMFAARMAGETAGLTTKPSTWLGEYALTKGGGAAMRKLASTPGGRRFLAKTVPTFTRGLLAEQVPLHPASAAREVMREAGLLKPTPTAKGIAPAIQAVVPEEKIAAKIKVPVPDEQLPKIGNINLTKYEPEVQHGIKELVTAKPALAAHKSISHKETISLASRLENTPVLKRLFQMPEGQLRAEVLKVRQGEDKAIRNLLMTDLGDLGRSMKDYLAHKQTREISRAAFEVGGALEQFKIPIKEQRVISEMILAKMKNIKTDPIISKEAKKTLIKGLSDFKKTVLSKDFNPTMIDNAYFVWLNSILSDPRTHMVNTGSNALFALAKIPEKFTQAVADLGLTGLGKLGVKRIGKVPLTGKRKVFFGEIPAMIKGLFHKGKVPKVAGSKFEEMVARRGWKKLLPTSLLQLEDDIGKGMIGRMEKFAQAYRKGVGIRKFGEKGLTGLGKIKTEQLYRTFQNQPGKIAKSLLKLRKNIPGLRWLIPFVKTPADIINAGIERTILGAAFLGKAATQEQLAQRVGLLGASSVAATWIGFQYFRGNVTGDIPSNKGEREMFYREGKQPNSIKLFDHWIPLERIEPIGSSFAMVANLIDRYSNSEKEMPAEKVMDSLSGLSKTLTNKTYLQGLTNLVRAMSNPEMYGASWGRKIISGMFTPGLLNYIGNLKDPYIRETTTVPETIKARLPFLSETVEPKMDVFGEKVERRTPAIPFRISKDEISSVDEELRRLDIFPTKIGKKYKGLPLSSEERNRMTLVEGQLMKKRLESLISLPGYQELNDIEKEKHIRKIITKTRSESRNPAYQIKLLNELNKRETTEEKFEYLKRLDKKSSIPKELKDLIYS